MPACKTCITHWCGTEQRQVVLSLKRNLIHLFSQTCMHVVDPLHGAACIQIAQACLYICGGLSYALKAPMAMTSISDNCHRLANWIINAGREGRVPLALESVLMSMLHAPVMQSLTTLHSQADAAIQKQAKMHCKAESKVGPCHKKCDLISHGAQPPV